MKFLKRLSAVAVSAVMMFSITSVNVFAASIIQDGLEVSLTTDKETYAKDEKITATLSVKNTNESDVTDITMETVIPNGYEVTDGTKNNKQLDKLAPNETTKLKVVYAAKSSGEVSQDSQVSQESKNSEVSTVSPSNDSPQTGDNATIPVAIAIVMLISVFLAIFCFKSKKGRKLLSLILCVSSVCGYFVLVPTKVNAVDTILKSLNISTSVKIEINDVSLNAIVRYSTEIFENPLNEYEIDTDSDGIPDVMENQLGLNPNSDDTDGDKLTDYFEYVNGVTDPKTADTDGNGISDFDEDSDDDGLKNGEEQAAGSYAFNQDSDDDKLLDGDEVHKYSTDPMKKDTDGDGLTDYEEIKLGLDPLKISSDGSVNDSKRKLPQTASDEVKDDLLRESDNWLVPQISGNVSGLLDNQISMIKDESLSFSDNHSILSDVIEIDSSCTSALTLTFSFKENYTGNPKQLVIAYYDNDAHELHLVDSHLSNEQNKIEGEITSSGYYFVMDVDEFLKSLGIDVMKNINISSVKTTSTSASTDSSIGKADIVFVVDTTSSMSDEIYNVQNNINIFADKMSNEYNVDMNYSLIEYRDIEEDGIDSTIVHNNLSSKWFTNINAFKSEVSGLTVDGGGDDPETPIDALELARMSNWRNGATKFVVLVTDAPSKENNTSGIKDMDEMAQKFASDGIIVSVITYNKSDYANLLEQTHGLYGYIYSNFSDILLQLADVIGTETHKGGDWIILDDYSVVQLKGSIEEITTIDSDEDGLKDSEELIEKKTIDLKPLITVVLDLYGIPIGEYIGNTEIEVWTFKSNPTLKDTDGDLDLDDVDPFPRSHQLNDRLINNLNKLSSLSEDYAKKKSLSSGDYVVDVSKWLPFMFIRQFSSSYVSDTWSGTGGAIDSSFVSYVRKNNSSVYDYFKSTKNYYANIEGELGDLYHLAATMTGYMYKSNFGDGFKFGLMPEVHINNLSGWAGDLQTAMNDAMVITNKSKDYNVFKAAMKNLIGYDSNSNDAFLNSKYSHTFDIDDMYADTDAYNIYNLLTGKSTVKKAFSSYYRNGYLSRFKEFTNNWSRKKVSEVTGTYTATKFMGIVRWPLLDYDFSSTQSNAAKDAFVDFLFVRIENE